jgi:hypothetical protein
MEQQILELRFGLDQTAIHLDPVVDWINLTA